MGNTTLEELDLCLFSFFFFFHSQNIDSFPNLEKAMNQIGEIVGEGLKVNCGLKKLNLGFNSVIAFVLFGKKKKNDHFTFSARCNLIRKQLNSIFEALKHNSTIEILDIS